MVHESFKQPCIDQPADKNELQSLRNENKRLKALLEQHKISWKVAESDLTRPPHPENPSTTKFSTEDKISLFRRLFQGRNDVYARRWESNKGKSGYSPACGNEWKPGICGKPKIKCGECSHRDLLPITDEVVFDHLSGKHTIGIYPLFGDDYCRFLAIDFDKKQWKEDTQSFLESCRELKIPAIMEISRSGKGAHIWIFFEAPVPAKEARRLGSALISFTCSRNHQLSLDSYDRLFPNQDTIPKGGFGNLIALPLQKIPRERGCSVFIDLYGEPYPDQWAFLGSINSMPHYKIEKAIVDASAGSQPLDISITATEDENAPWITPEAVPEIIPGVMPKTMTLILSNQIFIERKTLPQPLLNRLIRLAAFANPEFYKAQAMRFPVWNKPRIIGCAENHTHHIGLPRGCLDDVKSLLERQSIRVEIQEERCQGTPLSVLFTGMLRAEQKKALRKMLKEDTGILSAPTAFGKTVVAAALIAERKVNTLILVHRTELLRQWQERLESFLNLVDGPPGTYGGGKKNLKSHLDIAVMQSLIRLENLPEILGGYGQIIVDECHHISAFSFESILKQARARYVLGLTATPRRRDGHHPIIFMQCGSIRHHVIRSSTTPAIMEVRPQFLKAPLMPSTAKIQDVFHHLAQDDERTDRIAGDIQTVYREGRKILVLTERTIHLESLKEALGNTIDNLFVLHGRLSRKKRKQVLDNLECLGSKAPRIILATGRLIGEGFDHPLLDTLFLALPISWKGTLQQYAGRLHRYHPEKCDIRIYDYIEADHPQLNRMWEKRLRGYKAMGYRIHN
ncbi:MAG: DEAD/DEAH box helicase [Spirochaetes bacterium]|nr:MAG: DEAD/DEAH box helicase [Spirochaetota bacterium]